MEHKHTQSQIDAVINKWRGKHAGEKMIAEYDGNKWSSISVTAWKAGSSSTSGRTHSN